MDKKRFIAAALTIALASGCASQGASDATYVYGGDGSSGASGAPDTATTYFSSPAHDTDGFAETLIGGLADLAVARLAAPTFHSHARSDAPLHLRVNPAVTQVQRPAPAYSPPVHVAQYKPSHPAPSSHHSSGGQTHSGSSDTHGKRKK